VAIVTTASQATTAIPRGVATHWLPVKASVGKAMAAPTPITAAAISSECQPCCNSHLTLTAKTAKHAPATSDSKMPNGWTTSRLSDDHDSAITPATPMIVATSHQMPGRCRSTTHSINPASIGAEPSATIVPTMTPLLRVPSKNTAW